MGPIHFLYAKYLITSENKLYKRDLIHFVPFALFQLFIVKDLLKTKDELIQSFSATQSESLSGEFLAFNWIITIHVLFYVTLTLLIIRHYSLSLKLMFSSIEKLQLDWLRYITVFIGAGMVVFLIENTFMLGGYIISELFALSNVIFCIYVLAIGYLGLLKSEVFLSKDFSDSVHELPEISERIENEDDTRYKRSGLTDERAKDIMNLLLELMDREKPFTDNALTLNKLAGKLSITPHNLSEVINTKLNQNFFDFVNKYRVEKVKYDLLDQSKNNLTLLAIAIEAGFNSKSSFNSIFKKTTGRTPTEYRKQKV
jgi:AraC-like DNA-binding protein